MLATHGGGVLLRTLDGAAKAIFVDGDRGLCLYRTTGPYLAVHFDPVVRTPGERQAFVDALFAFASAQGKRPVFYHVSSAWRAVLHDCGFEFFKLGEEAHLPLDSTAAAASTRCTLADIVSAGKADVRARIVDAEERIARLDELRDVASQGLFRRGLALSPAAASPIEPSVDAYPCAIVEQTATGRIVAFASLLASGDGSEAGVDLVRFRRGFASAADVLLAYLVEHAEVAGVRRFNLGLALMASVGECRGARMAERLTRLVFTRTERWFQLQELRREKERFGPTWVPVYLAQRRAWEWPLTVASLTALSVGAGYRTSQSVARTARGRA
jgi:phosphatidylglycerol lysyltransferase